MHCLRNKNILIGITGSIAAYKIPLLVRILKQHGARVKVVMTPGAASFVTPETLSVLSGNPVLSAFFREDSHEWHNHVDLGLWADAYVIAPATANTMSKMAAGIADNLLLTTYLSARCPVFFAPAMDLDMYRHPSVKQAMDTLQGHGLHLIPPGTGELASGLVGEGRMAEPEEIAEKLNQYFDTHLPWHGKNVMVTAGPTYEKIDPVRFIGNHSSGKMGYAIAETLANQGANVMLISGPVAIAAPDNVELIKVTTAMEMYTQVTEHAGTMDVVVMAAAVADYRPEHEATSKIKKLDSELELKLVRNPDILAELGQAKHPGQLLIGFALETNNEMEHAADKMKRKHLDMIVLNSLQNPGAGFGHDTNQVTLLTPGNEAQHLPLMSKQKVASEIANAILQLTSPK